MAAGAEHVLLFTDLANPTSNSIYQKIGFRPVFDIAEFDLTANVVISWRVATLEP